MQRAPRPPHTPPPSISVQWLPTSLLSPHFPGPQLCPPLGRLLTDLGNTQSSLGRESENKKPASGEECVIWIYNDFFVWLIPPATQERPKWMKLLFEAGPSTRTVIAKEWSRPTAACSFSLGGVKPAWPPKPQPKQDFRQREPCVALYTYTYANARDGMDSCLECPSRSEGLPAPGPGCSPQSETLAACALNHLTQLAALIWRERGARV